MALVFEDSALYAPKGFELKEPGTWSRWFNFIQHTARTMHVWSIIDPEQDLLTENQMLGIPEAPCPTKIRNDLSRQLHAVYEAEYAAWLRADLQQRGPKPSAPAKSTDGMVRTATLAAFQEYRKAREAADETSIEPVRQMYKLIISTVDAPVLELAMLHMTNEGQSGTRALLRALKHYNAPPEARNRFS